MTQELTYEEAVRYMSGLLQFGPREGRARLRELLRRFDSPQDKLRCVHIAGTNGKGSTTTCVASILRAQGYKVGAYLSPYVFDLRERIQINGAMIPEADFARWVSQLTPEIEAIDRETDFGHITEFELKTAVAFCYFAEQQVDFAAVEVGIGGLLDSTNIIPAPLCAVIVSIGRDHMALLGDTPALIARQKAGIFKPGTIGVTAVPPGKAFDAITEVAKAQNIPLLTVAPANASNTHTDSFVTYRREADGTTSFYSHDTTLSHIRLGLRGAYQSGNAATAVAAIEVLRTRHKVAVSDTSVRVGLEQAQIPGRFQVLQPKAGAILVLDGAHNEDGVQTLVQSLQAEWPQKRFIFVVGTSKNHNPEPVLRLLAPLTQRIVATAPAFRPTPATETAIIAQNLGLPVTICEPAGRAIEQTYTQAQSGEVVVVTGSLYTVGETPPYLREG